MANYQEAIREAIRNGYCTVLGSRINFIEYWREINPRFPAFDEGVTRNLYRLYCNREPDNTPPSGGVIGGQCEFVQYSVTGVTQLQDRETAQVRTVSRTYTCNFPDNIFGPVGPARLDNSNPAAALVTFPHRNAQNNPVISILAQFDSNEEDWIGTDLTVNRCDNQPDNCGDSEPPPPPSTFNEYNTNITYTDENNTEITIPISLTFNAPFADVDANIRIPIDIDIDDPTLNIPIRFDADFNLSTGDINFNFGNNGGGDGRPRDCTPQPDDNGDAPSPPPNSNAPDTPPPEDPESEPVVIGALVTTTTPSEEATQIFGATEDPVLYVPALGYVIFRVRVGRTATAWTSPFAVKLTREYVECPVAAGALSARFIPRFGTVATLTPIYGVNLRPQSETP